MSRAEWADKTGVNPAFEIMGLTCRFPGVTAIDDVSLTVKKGAFFVVLGETSAGKTTLLRCLAGVEKIQAGKVWLAGKDATNWPIAKRNLSMVFQGFALFPHLTAAENLTYPLVIQGESPNIVAKRLDTVCEILSVGHIRHKKPAQLSGGERQRIAIGRAIISQPDLLLLDEPLTNLDAKLRHDMRVELKRLHRESGTTILYATPDQLEAMSLAEEVAVLHAGKIVGVASPRDHYHRPASLDIVGMIGQPRMNLIETVIGENGLRFDSDSRPIPMKVIPSGTSDPMKEATIGFHAHALQLAETLSNSSENTSKANATVSQQDMHDAKPKSDMLPNENIQFQGQVTLIEMTGEQAIISFKSPLGALKGVFAASKLPHLPHGKVVDLAVPMRSIVAFDPLSRQHINLQPL